MRVLRCRGVHKCLFRKVRHSNRRRSWCIHQAWGTITSIIMSISSLPDFSGGLGSIRLMVGLNGLTDLLQSKWFYDSVLVQNLFVEETMVSLHKIWLLVWLKSSRFYILPPALSNGIEDFSVQKQKSLRWLCSWSRHILKSMGVLLSMCCKGKQRHCFPTATSHYGSQTHALTNQSKVHRSTFGTRVMFFLFRPFEERRKSH